METRMNIGENEHLMEVIADFMLDTNQRSQMYPGLTKEALLGGSDDEKMQEKCRDLKAKVWKDPSYIDAYLAAHRELPEDEREIVDDLRMNRPGVYLVLKVLKEGAVFVCMDDEDAGVYLVKGSGPIWEYVISRVPVVVRGTLLSYRGMITLDYPLDHAEFVGNQEDLRKFRAWYAHKKQEGKLIKDLYPLFHEGKSRQRTGKQPLRTCWTLRIFPKGLGGATSLVLKVSDNIPVQDVLIQIVKSWNLSLHTCFRYGSFVAMEEHPCVGDLGIGQRVVTFVTEEGLTFLVKPKGQEPIRCRRCFQVLEFQAPDAPIG